MDNNCQTSCFKGKLVSITYLIIICSCASIEFNENLTLDTLKKILKFKSEKAEVVISGCLGKVNPDRIKEVGNFRIVHPRNLDDFDEIINPKVKMNDIPENGITIVPDLWRKGDTFFDKGKKFVKQFGLSKNPVELVVKNTKRFMDQYTKSYDIRIAKGCLGACSYCCIKVSTGRLESKPLDVIVSEFERGLKKGYKLFKLTGIDTGCYGLDIDITVVDLLRKIFSYDGSHRIIVTDFNPQWLVRYWDELLPIFLRVPSRLKEIEIPIQSGSNRILKLMKRPYNIDMVKEKLKSLLEKLPHLRIKTHVIAGFPGETEDDFNETKKLLDEVPFYSVAVFEYCDRPHTESKDMDNKNSQSVIAERAGILLEKLHELNCAT